MDAAQRRAGMWEEGVKERVYERGLEREGLQLIREKALERERERAWEKVTVRIEQGEHEGQQAKEWEST